MKFLDLTLPSPHGNIALDEALLDAAENDANACEILRIWEPESPIAVLGRSSPFSKEVNHDYCNANSIPVIRRSSGGQTIVTGPGCLMYCLLLDYRIRPELRMLSQAHSFVMTRMQSALRSAGIETEMNGTSDLTFGPAAKKFSGNAMRAKRNWMIYHGTLLCKMDLELIFDCSGTPIRQPDYRRGRTHRDFLTSLDVSTDRIKQAIVNTWLASDDSLDSDPVARGRRTHDWPQDLTRRLVDEKYAQPEWNQKVR